MYWLSQDIAISLVDDTFIFQARGRREPPLVMPAICAVQTGTARFLAFGQEALAFAGREPRNITVARILEEGGLADHDAAAMLVRYGLRMIRSGSAIIRPRVIVCIRSHDIVKRSVKDMAIAGGAREVYLIDNAMASAIGLGLDVQKPELRGLLNLSNDWFEFAVISLAGVLCKVTKAIGVDTLVDDARWHIRNTRNFLPDAGQLRSQLLSQGIAPSVALEVAGWEAWLGSSELGRLRTDSINAEVLGVGVMPSLIRLTESIKGAIATLDRMKYQELTKAEIHLCGMGARIPRLAETLARCLGLRVTAHPQDIHPSIFGTTRVLEELNFLRRVARVERRMTRTACGWT